MPPAARLIQIDSSVGPTEMFRGQLTALLPTANELKHLVNSPAGGGSKALAPPRELLKPVDEHLIAGVPGEFLMVDENLPKCLTRQIHDTVDKGGERVDAGNLSNLLQFVASWHRILTLGSINGKRNSNRR